MKHTNTKTPRKVEIRLSFTRNKFGARAYPVRWTYKVRAPSKEN